MAIRYKVKIINNPNGLPIRENPISTSNQVGNIANGRETIVNDTRTNLDGSVWFQLEDTSNWVLYQFKGMVNLKLLKNLSVDTTSGNTDNTQPPNNQILQTSYTTPSTETGRTQNSEKSVADSNSYVMGSTDKPTALVQTEPTLKELRLLYKNLEAGVKKGYTIKSSYRPYDVLQQNESSYPPVITRDKHLEYVYDYTANTNFLKSSIQTVKENLNVPSAYSRDQLNILMNSSFNRYNITYPDYMLNGLSGVVFFTRPDLYLVDDGIGDKKKKNTNSVFLEQVLNDPQLFYISRTNEFVLKQLTLEYSTSHQFIPLLCNTCKSLDVSDESVETLDIGETFSGYKMQYARHSIRSLVSGTFNCKFQESYDLAVTHMMQAWCSYESAVYLGTMLPKTEYIGKRILDYACSAYLFIVDRTNTIKYFTKYYGVFPINVNKSVYSYDDGSPIHFPEQNITFAYFHREDLSPRIIMDFNKHSNLPFNYKLDHEMDLGHAGRTWSGPPFVEVHHISNGTPSGTDQFILRYRPETN